MKKKNLTSSFQWRVLLLILALACTLGYLWLNLEINRSRSHSREIRNTYLSSEKRLLKAGIKHIINYVEHKKSLAEQRVRKEVKERTEEAFNTALYIYEQNKNEKSRLEITRLIHDALFAASWDGGKGYYFVIDKTGTAKVNRNNSQFESENISDLQDDNGNFIMQQILTSIQSEDQEGFCTYYWKRPGTPETFEPKISFVKYFEPLNWIIGNGKYIEDEKKIIKQEVLDWIEKINPGPNSYVFAGTWEGFSLVGPGKNKNMFDITDSNGLKVVQNLIAAAKQGGGFVEYVMPKLPGHRGVKKISYVAPIPDWKWYVGTGVYVDYIEDIIVQKQTAKKKATQLFLFQCMAAFIILCLFYFLVSLLLSRKIKRNIRLFQNFFKESASNALPIQLDKIAFKEFHSLAISANKMAKERQRAWQSLKKNQSYLKSVFNAPNEAIIVYDPEDGSVLDVNRAMLEMYDISYEEAVMLPPQNISFGQPPYDYPEALKKIQKAVTDGPQTFEWRAAKKTGESFWLEISLSPTVLNDKALVIAVQRNIDSKKKAEQILAAEQERLTVTLRSIADGVITVDTEKKIVLINKAAEIITGWKTGEALGEPIPIIFNIVDGRSGKQCETPVEKTLLTGKSVDQSDSRLLITHDGNRLNIAYNSSPIRDRTNKIIGAVLVFRDITNEKKTERELLKIRQLESVGVLAGGIAHDFNNILSAILGNIELSLQAVGTDHEISSLLSDAINATLRAAKLTQQLLTFAKGGEPVKETTALPLIIKESAEFILHGSNIDCSYDFPANLSFVNIDPGQMGQVIQNIILNARHAMPEGGRIEVKCTNIENAARELRLINDTGEYIKITIQDSGTGIPKDLVGKIFDPYFSTRQEGSGLGLAICHSIINKHGGYIVADSTPGHGSLFTIYLPATIEAIEHKTDNDKTSKSPGLPSRPVTVMVMDDELVLRTVAQYQLEFLGYRAILVADGLEAIDKYKEMRASGEEIDIVIMDLTIPGGMGGQEAVKELLKINPDARVIVSSGYSTDPIMANYQEYGFQAALAKPLVLKELQKMILSIL